MGREPQYGRVHRRHASLGSALIVLAKARSLHGRRLLAGNSYGGGRVLDRKVVRESDFLLLHGNSVEDPFNLAIHDLLRMSGRQHNADRGFNGCPKSMAKLVALVSQRNGLFF